MAWIRRVGGLFTWRRVFLALGLLALGLLVWFGGPLLAIADWKPLASVAARLVFLLLLLVVYLSVSLWRARRQRRDNEKVVTEMMAGGEQDDLLKEEIDTQRASLRKALALMKQWKPGRFRSVYELPWYMIIGAPGSGKSTALLNSGLEFPLRSEMGLDSVKGVGGTRYCDWWFTNKAVIIDTAGRYTTQESGDKRDARGWNSFLGLLRKYRSRQPVNGVILSISVADLLEQTPTERQLHARAIKQRVQELRNRLGVVFPVYILLTKFDLLEGFADTFAMLSEQEREEVFGMTFDLHSVRDAQQLPAVFEQEFDGLLERLSHFLLHRLQQERTPDCRRRIYQFPKQVALLKAPLWQLVKEVFFPSAYEDVPLLRGVYLVSSEQNGRTCDKLSGMVDKQFQLNTKPAVATGNPLPSDGFFLHKLFENIIFSEQGLASADGTRDRRYRLVRQLAFAGMILVTLGLGVSGYFGYQWSRDLIARYEADTSALQEELGRVGFGEPHWQRLEDLLSRASGMPGVMGTPLPEGGFHPLGTFRTGALQQAAEGAYGRLLQYRFSDHLKESLESEITTHLSSLEYLYESLKTYLMVTSRDRLEPEQVALWFEFMLSRRLPGEVNRPSRESLGEHLEHYLALNHSLQPSRPLISQARAELTAMPLDERAYQRIRSDAAMSGLPEFRLSLVLGSIAEEVFDRRSGASLREGIPGLYTINGYRGVFEPERDQIVGHLLEDSWVYGEETDSFRGLDEANIKRLVEERYFRDYVHHWQEFLKDLQVRRFSNAREGRYITSLLAGPDAPVDRLLAAVKYNTELSAEDEGSETLDAVRGAASETLARRNRQFDRMRRFVPENVASAQELTLVDRSFRTLNDVGEETLQSLRDRARLMARYFSEQEEGQTGSFATVSAADFDGAIKSFYGTVSNTQSEELLAMLGSIPTDARRLVRVTSTQRVNDVWRSEVYRDFQEAIAGHYPFQRHATTEVALADFAAFFGYGGTLDRYFEEHLASQVDTTRSPWRLAADAEISAGNLRLFEQARRIREAFFVTGTRTLKSPFTLRPAYLDSRLTSVSLSMGDQSLTYRHEPPRSTVFEWPLKGSDEIRVVLNPGSGSASAVQRTFNGDWGLFRFLDEYGGLQGQGRARNVEILLGGYLARLELSPDSVRHPFDVSLFSNFRVPPRL